MLLSGHFPHPWSWHFPDKNLSSSWVPVGYLAAQEALPSWFPPPFSAWWTIHSSLSPLTKPHRMPFYLHNIQCSLVPPKLDTISLSRFLPETEFIFYDTEQRSPLAILPWCPRVRWLIMEPSCGPTALYPRPHYSTDHFALRLFAYLEFPTESLKDLVIYFYPQFLACCIVDDQEIFIDSVAKSTESVWTFCH